MPIPRQRRTKAGGQPRELVLAGIGSSGPWEISIDESTAGTDRWFAQIDGPSVYLHFEIPSLQIVDQVLGFFACSESDEAHEARSDTLAIGAGKSDAQLFRDDEFSGRFFLVTQPNNGPLVRLTIAGDDLTHLLAALRQVAEDLR